jgi:hypothetical protein
MDNFGAARILERPFVAFRSEFLNCSHMGTPLR